MAQRPSLTPIQFLCLIRGLTYDMIGFRSQLAAPLASAEPQRGDDSKQVECQAHHLFHLHPIQNGPIVVSAAPYSHLLSAFPVACFLCNTQALSKSLKSGAEEHLYDHKDLLLISPIGSSIQCFPILCFCRYPSLVAQAVKNLPSM